jgi:hypothetical protein
MTTQTEIRAAFWSMLKEFNPELYNQRKPGKPQNEQPTDIRCIFVDYVDELHRDGQISDRLANNVTL